MKRRSRQPAKPLSFSGSGEPSAATDRKGKDEGRQQQQRSRGAASSASSGDEISATRSVSSAEEATGRPRRPPKKERRRCRDSVPVRYVKSPVGDVQVSSGIVQSPNQEQPVKHSGGSSHQPASNSEGDAQVAVEAYAAPLSEVIGDGSTCDILMEGYLDDSKLSSRSGSVEEQQGSSFDEEISTWPKVEDKKPKSSSVQPSRNIAQVNEDELSGKNTRDGDLGNNMAARDEDYGQHSENIGAVSMEVDHGERKGTEVERVQAIVDMDDDTIRELTLLYSKKIRSAKSDAPDDCAPLPPYDSQQLTEVYEQLAFYRIRGYKLSVEQQSQELDDENLKKHYSSTDLYNNEYFQDYENCLEWYFDPQHCKIPDFDYYQRLVLHDNGEYRDYYYYHKVQNMCNTFEEDMAYVEYYEALVKETKWIEDYVEHCNIMDKWVWDRVENMTQLQALQIGQRFRKLSLGPVRLGFYERLRTIRCNNPFYQKKVRVYFEIWKRVAKLKMDFRAALLQIQSENIFPNCPKEIEDELKGGPRIYHMKYEFNAYTAGIDETASDDKACQHIREAILEMTPIPKNYYDYVKKKIDIAKAIQLIG